MTNKTKCNLLERQYKVAIDARDKLNDNYHKWMTFYYVANGAILVATTDIYKANPDNITMVILSAIGVFTCIIWNLSCRGYYYWSLSWIEIIMFMERKIAQNDYSLMPYSMFSEDVANRYDNKNNPFIPANISTPKLTLRFSIFSIICWSLLFAFEYINQIPSLPFYLNSIILIIILSWIYGLILIFPEFVKSRVGSSHILISFQKLKEDEDVKSL